MKTKEELNALKEEIETLNKKLAELTAEELAQVTGGEAPDGHNKPDLEYSCHKPPEPVCPHQDKTPPSYYIFTNP